MMHTDDDFHSRPSKQQQKREAEAAQALGTELVGLPAAQLTQLFDTIELPEKLREAVLACRAIKSHGAHRRQLQYIGKLMRNINLEPVRNFLMQLQHSRQAASAQHHQLEDWRARLLNEGETALVELLQAYPTANENEIRALVQRAQKEVAHNQPPRAARQLFRCLRDLMGGQA